MYAYIFVCICIYTYIFFQKRQLYKNLLKEPKDKQTVNLSHDLQEETWEGKGKGLVWVK